MPHFYFNVHDGRSKIDTEGSELPSRSAAQIMAIEFAGEILRDEARQIACGKMWSIEVTDTQGVAVYQIDIHFNDTRQSNLTSIDYSFRTSASHP